MTSHSGHVTRPHTGHIHYRLFDLGTFGGPSSSTAPEDPYVLNGEGAVTGGADTSVLDPNSTYANPFFTFYGLDPYIQHAFAWEAGRLVDLGALPGLNNSYSFSIANRGIAAGVSTNGTIDPLTGYVEGHAVVWKGGRIADIGTFGGNESFAQQVNDRAQVAGSAATTISDPYDPYGWGTQAHAFLWRDGAKRDLGTLGGPDSFAFFVNAAGQVAGFAYTSYMVNPGTGLPTIHPFLWEPRSRTMRDLGTIGGTLVNGIQGLNARGEVIGFMTIAGDQDNHAFVWNGRRLVDLGTFGGPNSAANGLNDAGAVVGGAQYPSGCGSNGPPEHAALWERGRMIDLGLVRGMVKSGALAVNANGQAVGYSSNCDYTSQVAVLWDHGDIVDLNKVVRNHPNYSLFVANAINDRGEIAGIAVTSNTLHAFALVPCADNRDCGDSATARTDPSAPEAQISPALAQRIHTMLAHRRHFRWSSVR